MPPSPQYNSRSRVKACLACRKQKVRCSAKEGQAYCQRCRKRNIECIWNRSGPQSLSNNEETPIANMVEDLHMLHTAINNILADKNQPLLNPLKSLGTDAPSTGPSNPLQTPQFDETDHWEPDTRDEEDAHISDSVEPLNPNPIKSLYEVTQLGSLRPRQLSTSRLTNGSPDSAHLLSDMVSQGKLGWNDANRLTARFLNQTDYYLYGILKGFDSTESVRRASPLLFTAICTVSALHEPQGGALFQVCSLELRRLVSNFVFANKATVHDFQGLCIASFWLSDVSWSVSGLAIRRAIEFQLGRSFGVVVGDESVRQRPGTKIQFTSREDALSCLRVWYLFFVCDHHMSILYGRPSSFGVQAAVNNWARYFKAIPKSIADTRISSQIELLLLLEKVTQLLGASSNTPTPLIFKAQLDTFDSQLDQWVATWSNRYEQQERIGDYPRKSLSLHYFFSKLFLSSHVFRGLSPDPHKDPIPTEFHQMAQTAVRSARSIIELVTQDEVMRNAFVGMPHYYHTFVAYACSFLLKLHTEYRHHLDLEKQDVLVAISRVIELCQQTDCASYHLVRWMEAGLQKLVKHCEKALARQNERQGESRPSQGPLSSVQNPGHDMETEGERNIPNDAENLFSEICQDIIPSSYQIGNGLDSDGDLFNPFTDSGPFEEDWGSVLPAFGSEYLGLGLL